MELCPRLLLHSHGVRERGHRNRDLGGHNRRSGLYRARPYMVIRLQYSWSCHRMCLVHSFRFEIRPASGIPLFHVCQYGNGDLDGQDVHDWGSLVRIPTGKRLNRTRGCDVVFHPAQIPMDMFETC